MSSPRRSTLTAGLIALAVAASALVAPATATAATPVIERIAGADRYETAAKLSAHAFPSARGGTVFIASGALYPDALSAAPAAKANNAPVLLTDPAALPSVVSAELRRLAPTRIVMVGGESAVSAGVATALRGYAGQVDRIAGADRYETSALISQDTFLGTTDAVYLSSGANFPDALGASAEAARTNVPVLLTSPSDLPAATAAEIVRLQPRTVYVTGGTSVVSDGIVARIGSLLSGGVTVQRLGGADRYETSALIAADAATRRPETVYLASGTAFPDALAAAPASAAVGAPVLLTDPGFLPQSISKLIDSADPARLVIVGAEGAVSANVGYQLGAPADDSTRALAMVNALRAAGGLYPLKPMPALDSLASSWSREMGASGYRHNPNVGSQIPARWRAWGENIARSSVNPVNATPEYFVSLWRDSPPHYRNIMSTNFTHVGFGRDSSTGTNYATQVFAGY